MTTKSSKKAWRFFLSAFMNNDPVFLGLLLLAGIVALLPTLFLG